MRIHYFQHVDFEGLGLLKPLLEASGHTLSSTRFFEPSQLEQAPSVDDYDALIVMGGPMGIYDNNQYPWLKAEKLAIKQAIDAGKNILGICLGAQLIADCLGAPVMRNHTREIGWFPVELNQQLINSRWQKVFCEEGAADFTPMHWHGDTFLLPREAILLGSSQGCTNQGFILEQKAVERPQKHVNSGQVIVGLQFHLELESANIEHLCEACVDEIADGGEFVQTREQMLANGAAFERNQKSLVRLLAELF